MASIQIKIDPVFPSDSNFLAKKGAFLLASLENTVKGDIKDQLKGAMEKRVANWKHKPEIKDTFSSLPTRLSLLLMPAGRNSGKWRMVSGGVPRHFIFPKSIQKKRLFIRGGKGGYSPKTRPGNFYGGSGSYSNNHQWALVVSHPGIQAREFEKHVVEEETPKVVNKIQAVIDRAAKL